MKKRIIFFLLLIFLSINVEAKRIKINDINYDAKEDFEGYGYRYDQELDTLYLDSYYGKEIISDDNLTINVKGDCVIMANTDSYGLSAEDVNILGSGKLYIKSKTGINSTNLTINGVLVYIDSETGIIAFYNFNMLKATLVIKSTISAITNYQTMNFKESLINIFSDIGISAGNQTTLTITDSKMLIDTKQYAFYSIRNSFINNSIIKIKNAKEESIHEGLIKYDEYNYHVYTSNDGLSYNEFPSYRYSSYYYVYPYLVITPNENTDLLSSDTPLLYVYDECVWDNTCQNNINENTNYTENEYPNNDISNPSTVDNIWLYTNILVVSIISLAYLIIKRSNYETS